ncbi:MAG: hypothetical protein KF845_02375 [Cyclobacteriaceae bacterium]|nr:hypothetical protein [Cyclobacteriaceae bacterium]
MKTWALILVVLILEACGTKSELSIEGASIELCACFNSQTTGTIDDRLSPCLQQIVNNKNDEWQSSGIINQDTIKYKLSMFTLHIMIDMTRTCENYFAAVNELYDKGYPTDTTELNKKVIKELSTRIETEVSMDSVKSLLHKKVYRLIQAKEFDMALQSIDSIKSLDDTDYDANLASAYIFNQKGLHDKAVIEITRAIELSGNENLKLYAEIAKKKKLISKN